MDQDAENAFLDDEDLALNKLKDLGFPTEYDDEDYILDILNDNKRKTNIRSFLPFRWGQLFKEEMIFS